MASAARKPAPVPVLEPVIPGDLVDTLGDLAKLRADFAATERKYRHALDSIKALCADADPDAAFTAKGERYSLHISAQGFESKPNVSRVRKLLSKSAFMKCVSITKTALAQFLLKPEIEEVCDVTQSGHRAFETVPIAAAVIDAALGPVRAPAARAGDAPRLKKQRA